MSDGGSYLKQMMNAQANNNRHSDISFRPNNISRLKMTIRENVIAINIPYKSNKQEISL